MKKNTVQNNQKSYGNREEKHNEEHASVQKIKSVSCAYGARRQKQAYWTKKIRRNIDLWIIDSGIALLPNVLHASHKSTIPQHLFPVALETSSWIETEFKARWTDTMFPRQKLPCKKGLATCFRATVELNMNKHQLWELYEAYTPVTNHYCLSFYSLLPTQNLNLGGRFSFPRKSLSKEMHYESETEIRIH